MLSTLGIVIGVASLVAVLSLGDGMQGFMRSQIGETTDLQVMSVSARASLEVDGVTLPRADTVRFTPSDVDALRGAVDVPARIGLFDNAVALTTARSRQRAVRVMAIDPVLLDIQNVKVGRGRALTDAASDSAAVLLSEKAAIELSDDPARPLAPGDSVTLGGARLVVAGILSGSQSARDVSAVTRPHMAPRVSSGRPGSPVILLRADRFEDVPKLRAAVERWLATRAGAGWKERATIANRADRVAQAQQGMLLFKLFMGAITGISLIVGGIGVMNVLLAAVAERTREIGVRRAVGAARRHILAQFLAEAVTISGLGSVMGILLGLGGAYGITAAMRTWSRAKIYAGVSPSTILVAVGATVIVGVSFGLYPALLASRLSPIDAIRHE
jgi:putative ABC transport system permease protein